MAIGYICANNATVLNGPAWTDLGNTYDCDVGTYGWTYLLGPSVRVQWDFPSTLIDQWVIYGSQTLWFYMQVDVLVDGEWYSFSGSYLNYGQIYSNIPCGLVTAIKYTINNPGTLKIYEVALPFTVDFSGVPLVGDTCEPLEVVFTSNVTPNSCGNPSPTWDFGDGSSSEDWNPTHIYNVPGLYTVQLTVEWDAIEVTETKTDYVDVPECPNLECARSLVVDVDDVPRIAFCHWSSSNGNGGETDLVYSYKDGEGWHFEVVDDTTNCGMFCSLALTEPEARQVNRVGSAISVVHSADVALVVVA